MTEDITRLEGEDLTVVQAEIRTFARVRRQSKATKPTACGSTGHFDDNIVWLCDVGDGSADDLHVLLSNHARLESLHRPLSFTDFEARGNGRLHRGEA